MSLTMVLYGDAMQEAADSGNTGLAEARLRQALDRDDEVLGTIAPVLRHRLTNDDQGLFGDEIVARVRGMTTDAARQLLERLAVAEGTGGVDDDVLAALTAAILEHAAFLRHVHALALEWQLTERLQARLALDPVLSPLLQALIGSPDPDTAALAMQSLAAQARFGQAQRRMKLPLGELPGDLLHGVLLVMRTFAGTRRDADARAAMAEAAIRKDYVEGRSRLGLLSQLVNGMGAGAFAALSVGHAGAALFLSTLAAASRQDRDLAILSTSDAQRTRLALTLATAGLKPAAIEEQFLALHPDADLPAALDRLSPDGAAAILAAAGGFAAA